MPGAPVPPAPKIPQAPTDLVAQQSGERVILRWTLPQFNTDGTRLSGPPRVEVLRAFVSSSGPAPSEGDLRLAYTIPESVVEIFSHGGIVVFPDALGAATLREQAGRTAVYAVKAVNARGQGAGLSNLASLRVYPVASPVARVETQVQERAIELRWEPPARTSSGNPLEAIAGYQVYRSETGQEGSFALHGTAATSRYEDTQVHFGAHYFYRVRTLAQYGTDTVESENSVTVEVAPRDLFPPPVPQRLIAVVGPARVDLTWDASAADDLAGYFVYRSETPGEGYERLHREAVRAQSFADRQARPGVRYYYAVTAADQAGNESPFSPEVEAIALPQN